MSVYSGFATRQLEQQYSSLLQLLLLTLGKRLVKFYKNEQCNEKAFRGIFYRIVGGLKIMENKQKSISHHFKKSKYVPPKYSDNVKTLYEILQSLERTDVNKLDVSICQQIKSDKPNLMYSNGFEQITKEANSILPQTPNRYNFHRDKAKFMGMPPHPLKVNRTHQDSSADRSNYGTLPNNSNLKDQMIQADVSLEHGLKQKEETKHSFSDNEQKKDLHITSSFGQGENQEIHHLPQIQKNQFQQQQQLVIPQEVLEKIQKNVEEQILQKYAGQKHKKKSKSRNKKKGTHGQFRQLLVEFDETDALLNKTFNQQILDSNGHQQKHVLLPVSEQSRTRPKFYSVGK